MQNQAQAESPEKPREEMRQSFAATGDAFLQELRRERARVDRENQFFAVVMFQVPHSRAGDELADRLAKHVLGRMRATDYMGWFDHHHIAVILDSCLVCSALSFGNEICRELSKTTRPPLRVVVQTYPQQLRACQQTSELCKYACACDNAANKGSADDRSGPRRPGDCPSVCLQKTGFLPSSITVEYEGLPGIPVRPKVKARQLPTWKRAADVAASLLGLVIMSPVLLVTYALLRLAMRGPAIFRQERVGYLGRPFTMLKFKTMVDSRESHHREAMRRIIQADDSDEAMDPIKEREEKRVTPLGLFLRKTAIDELPQLVNVLRGEMSLVGPRPPIPYEVEVYKRWHGGRLDAVPGVTGLWQVSGMNALSFKEMARLDIYYSRNMSPWLDLKIVIQTPLAVLRAIFKPRTHKKCRADVSGPGTA